MPVSRWTLLSRIAAPVLAVVGTGAGEGHAVSGDALTPLGVDAPPDKGVDALPDKGVDAPPDKGIDAPPDKGVGTPPDKGVDALPDKGVDASPDKGVDAPPDKGVDAPVDKGSCTSPGKDSAGAISAARLLLALSLDGTATDDEAMRTFSSFAIPNVSSATSPPTEMVCRARGVNGQERVLHPSVAAVEAGSNGRVPFSSSTRALAGLVASWSSACGVNGQGRVLHPPVAAVKTGPNGRAPSPPLRGFGGLGRRLRLSTRNKLPGASSPPLRCSCLD